MNEIYLDSKSKDYYYSDFNENVLNETHPDWKLSENVKHHLIELNNCIKIQPLYSKFPDNVNSLSNNESYIQFAYTKEIELCLFRKILPYFISKYNSPFESKFYYLFIMPKDNPNFIKNSKFKSGCNSNPDYFRINHIHFFYENQNIEKHKEFWEDLTCIFKEIK